MASSSAVLSLDTTSGSGSGVFQFTSDFTDSIFTTTTGNVLTAGEVDALLKTIDSDGIISISQANGKFMLIMSDSSTSKSYLYEVTDTSGDLQVGSGDTTPITLVGIFEASTTWVTGDIV